jgi:hypothetical protein
MMSTQGEIAKLRWDSSIQPGMVLKAKDKLVNKSRRPSSDGMVPASIILLKSNNSTRFRKKPISVGISPVMRFYDNLKDFRLVSIPSSVGNLPEILLPEKSRHLRFVTRPTSVAKLPSMFCKAIDAKIKRARY